MYTKQILVLLIELSLLPSLKIICTYSGVRSCPLLYLELKSVLFISQDGYCHNKLAWCGASLSNYSTIPSGDLDSLRVAVATKGPVAVAIDASHKSFSFYDFGVYYEPSCGKHACKH